IWQRSVAQERVEFAENFYQIAGKSRSRRGGGSPFAPYNPRQNLVPVLGSDRPAGMLRPFSFLRSVPVAFVAPAQTLFLFGDPTGFGLDACLANGGEERLVAFSSRIDAKAAGNGVHRESDVEIGRAHAELQSHLNLVCRLLL